MTSSALDSTNSTFEEGALPGLDGKGTVLGVPETKAKSKTNVRRLLLLVIVLLALVFIFFGTMWFLKKRAAAAPVKPVATVAGKPAGTGKNEAVESEGIEKTKAAIKEKQAKDDAAKKAAEDAAAVAAATAASSAGGAAPSGGANATSTTGTGAARPQGAASSPAKPASVPLTPDERRLAGGVFASDPSQREVARSAQEGATAIVQQVQQREQPLSADNALAARLQPTVLAARNARVLPNLDYLLKKGAEVPCALNGGIDTTLPGFISCKTISDVYSANGATLLLRKGSDVFGERQGSMKQGETRTFVLWTRIDTPEGVSIDVDSPATDQMGYGGIDVDVDTHFWQRFGGAIMLSLISDFGQALTEKQTTNSNSGPTYQNTQQATQNMASEALRNSINIPPVGRALPAKIVFVKVARDVSFENVYTLAR